MTLAFMIAAIAVIAVVAMLAVGRLGELPEVEGDRAPLALPEDRPLEVEDVDGVRFAVGLRGYRMDEVDDVLDRLADDIAARDARIAQLESQVAGGAALAGTALSAPAPVSAPVDATAATQVEQTDYAAPPAATSYGEAPRQTTADEAPAARGDEQQGSAPA